jgi:hypothetical protein
MPADFSEYVNLTIHDKDTSQLYREMIEVARAVLPEFTLRRGTIEDAIFQSLAYTSAVATSAINRVPDGIMEGVVSLLGYQRNLGIRATATATIELYGSEGALIPLGTEFRYRYTDQASGNQVDYLFVTDEDVVIVDDTPPSGTLTLVCDTPGELPEPTIGSTELTPLSVDNDIDSVVFASFENGTEPDSDIEYLGAAKTYLEGISSTYVTAKQLEAAILTSYSYVSRCKVYDLMNSQVERGVLTFLPDETKNVTSSTYKGYVSVFLYGFNRELTSEELSEIQLFVASRCVAGLDITVSNFQVTSPSVSVTASFDSTYTQSVVSDEIKSAVSTVLSTQSFPYEELSVPSPRIRSSLISSTIFQSVPGILFVDSVQFTPDAGLAYTAVGNSSGDAIFTLASTTGLEIGQRVRVIGVSGDYDSDSVLITDKTITTITLDMLYASATDTGTIYPYFHETAASSDVNFLNRGVLPGVSFSDITVTLNSQNI